MEIPPDAAELAHRIVEIASDKKGNDIVLLRTAELTTMADFFVIASGRSDRQVQALAGAIVDELRDDGIRPMGVEGKASARWVLLDYGSGDRPRLRSRGARVLRPRAALGQGRAGRPPRLNAPPEVLRVSPSRGGPSVPLRRTARIRMLGAMTAPHATPRPIETCRFCGGHC